jgi:LAS superfamily LD-carboxypeptidase LdcB
VSSALFLLDPAFLPWAKALIDAAERYAPPVEVTSTFRSYAEQHRLYQEWVAGRHPYPVAPPGKSAHNYGMAVDLVSSDNNWLGGVWRYWGGVWSPTDEIHYGVW